MDKTDDLKKVAQFPAGEPAAAKCSVASLAEVNPGWRCARAAFPVSPSPSAAVQRYPVSMDREEFAELLVAARVPAEKRLELLHRWDTGEIYWVPLPKNQPGITAEEWEEEQVAEVLQEHFVQSLIRKVEALQILLEQMQWMLQSLVVAMAQNQDALQAMLDHAQQHPDPQ